MAIIREMVEALEENKYYIHRIQAQIESLVPSRSSRNRNTHSGWVVPGRSGWTRAINEASGFLSDNYWSGSLPTPSTQYPLAYAAFLEEHFDVGHHYQDRVRSIIPATLAKVRPEAINKLVPCVKKAFEDMLAATPN